MKPHLQEASTSPVLIFGMHRSGTSLAVKLLEKIGGFFGADQQADNESMSFLLANEAIFRSVGATWDNPGAVRSALDNHQTFNEVFVGVKKYLSNHGIDQFGTDQIERAPFWGWKDPRLTFTFRVWRQAFPGARAIIMKRHGHAVAQSLSRRHKNLINRYNQKFHKNIPEDSNFSIGKIEFNAKILDLQTSIFLWDEYMQEIDRLKSLYYADILVLDYAEAAESPEKFVQDVSRFLSFDMESVNTKELLTVIKHDASSIKSDILFEIERTQNLKAIEATLRRWGYSI